MTAIVDCHWRVVPPAVPPASAPAPGDVDTVVSTTREPFHVGSELSAGQQLDLVRGLAEITFRSGARIVLNGPAHFTVGSPLGGKLQVGKLTARVPHDAMVSRSTLRPAKSSIWEPNSAWPSPPITRWTWKSFVGEVAVDSSAADSARRRFAVGDAYPPQKLTAGHAVRVVAGQPVVSIPLDPKRFVRGLGPREDRSRRARPPTGLGAEFEAGRFGSAWKARTTDRVLHDEMGGPDAKLSWDGPGNPFVEGRVGKGLWLRGIALRRIMPSCPSYPQAEHGKLSVSAWVYADSHPARSTILSNWADSEGIGQFFLTVHANGGGKSASLVAHITQRDGQVVTLVEPDAHPFPLYEWQHVAFTTDGTTLRLYRQGREVGMAKHAGLRYPVRLKIARNWREAERRGHRRQQ